MSMFRSARLKKAMIVGPKTELRITSETLHALRLIHIDNFSTEAGGMAIGEPLDGVQELSKTLLKVRRALNHLEISPLDVHPRSLPVKDIKSFISNDFGRLETEIDGLVTEKEELSRKTEEMSELLESIAPIMEISGDARFDIGTLGVVAGYCRKDLSATLLKMSPDMKVQSIKKKVGGRKTNMYLIYFPRKVEKTLLEILALAEFQKLNIPAFHGSVDEMVKKLRKDISTSNLALEKINEHISDIKDREGHRLLAAEEVLADDVEKAELPLRCATTDNFFTIEGWIKASDAGRLTQTIESRTYGKVTVQILDEEEVGENAPVLLKHTPPVRHFYYMVKMYSTPNFKEIDPTLFLALIFPVFFGLMVGDLGYGIVLMIMGQLMKKRPIFGIGGNAVGNILLVSGFASAVFGAFVFTDMFGIPFHRHIADEMTWETLLGIEYPINSMVGKLDSHSVITLLVFSVIVGFVHMTIALAIGMFNSLTHRDAKHIISRVGWLLLLTAIFILAMNQAQNTALGEWVTQNLMFNVQETGLDFMGIVIPYMTIVLGIAGIALAVVTEGLFAIMESISMLTNLISYTRLAAVGISKAGLAFAMNIIFIDMIMPHGPVMFVMGLAGFIVAELLLIVLLGTLSVGIQALRLHYVEFFMKFYEGGGKPFKAFGPRNVYARNDGVIA